MEEGIYNPFRTVQGADGKVMIAIGNQIATKKQFNSHEEAERYIESKPWELIAVLALEIAHNYEQIKKQEK